ncbi:MAG: DUF481 domain-containing protein [Flavobacteriales bacterium]|nr:DUF481 domain-containing protein [Flavobacteriales bacterium]
MRSVVLGLFLIFCFNGYGQVQHIEARRIYNDTVGWAGNIDFNFSALQNRDLLINLGVKPFVQFKDSSNYFLALVEYNYSVGKERVFANAFSTHFRYNRYFRKDIRWIMWEFYTQGQLNPLLSQRVRALAGTGPRFRLFGNKDYKLYSGTSYMYEYEEIIVDNSIQRNHRVSTYIAWFFDPLPHFSFGGSTYYQPLLTDFKDYRISGMYTLRFRMFKRASFKFDVGFLYDSQPPTDVRNFVFNAGAGAGIDLNRLGIKRKKRVKSAG